MNKDRFIETKAELMRVPRDLAKSLSLTFDKIGKKNPGINQIIARMDGMVLTGSSIFNTFHKKQRSTPGTDFDFFFKGENAYKEFSHMLTDAGVGTMESPYGGVEIKSNVFYSSSTAYRIQMPILFPSVNFVYAHLKSSHQERYKDIVDRLEPFSFIQGFDFMHLTGVLDYSNSDLILTEDAADCIENNILKVNPRVEKFIYELMTLVATKRTEPIGQFDAEEQTPSLLSEEYWLLEWLNRYKKFVNRGMIPTESTTSVFTLLEAFLGSYLKIEK